MVTAIYEQYIQNTALTKKYPLQEIYIIVYFVCLYSRYSEDSHTLLETLRSILIPVFLLDIEWYVFLSRIEFICIFTILKESLYFEDIIEILSSLEFDDIDIFLILFYKKIWIIICDRSISILVIDLEFDTKIILGI